MKGEGRKTMDEKTRAKKNILSCILIPTIIIAFVVFPISNVQAEGQDAEGVVGSTLGLLQAVNLALAQNNNIENQRFTVASYSGALNAQQGSFDPVLSATVEQSRTNTPFTEPVRLALPIDKQATNSLTYTLGASTTLRTGTVLTPAVQVVRKDVTPDYTEPEYTSAVTFTVVQPLLKDRGRLSTAYGEMAAEINLAASQADLEYTIAQYIFDTIQKYWAARSSYDSLQVLRGSESLMEVMVDGSKKLIEADMSPAADLEQLQGYLANKTATRISYEQSLFANRQYLGLALGVPIENVISLPLPSDDFPIISEEYLNIIENEEKYTATALRRRADLRGKKLWEEAAEITMLGLETKLLPDLDLTLSAGYSSDEMLGYMTHGYNILRENIAGVNSTAKISFSWPTFNNSAEGTLQQQEAYYQQLVLSREYLEKEIASQVSISLSEVHNAILEYNRSRDSSLFYQRSLANEEEKRRLGMATQLDVIWMDERLTNAQLAEISARSKYAVAVAQFRFITGTLVDTSEGNGSINLAQLITIPELSELD